MARVWKGRYINPLIWEDEWFQSLTMPEQHLFNYLLTNPRSTETNIGVYQLNLNTAAYHTKIDLQEVKRIFADRFQPEKRAFYEVGWVVLPKWIRHQSTNNNANMWTRAANQFSDIPDWLNRLVLEPTSPMFMDVHEMSEGILEVEIIPAGTVANGKVPYGRVLNAPKSFAKEKGKGKEKGKYKTKGENNTAEGGEGFPTVLEIKPEDGE